MGLPGVIAHGMLTMALAAQYVAEWAGDPAAVRSFSTRFTRPVVVPDDDEGSSLELGATVKSVDDDGDGHPRRDGHRPRRQGRPRQGDRGPALARLRCPRDDPAALSTRVPSCVGRQLAVAEPPSAATTARDSAAEPRAFGCTGNAGAVGISPSIHFVPGAWQTSWPTVEVAVST